jgi:acetyl esterase
MSASRARRSSIARPSALLIGACLGLALVGCSTAGDEPKSNATQERKMMAGELKSGTPNAQMRAVLDELAALKPKPIDQLSPEEARRQPDATMAVKELLKKQGKPTTPNDGVTVENRTIPGAEGELQARVYTPPGDKDAKRPLIVYFRGSGWVIATLDTYEPSCRALAALTGAKVISVNYRQGPEHPFPAAHEDAYAAFQWAVDNAEAMGCDQSKVAVVGESAGGNLAAATVLMARDRGGKVPVGAVLVYPVAGTPLDPPTPSHKLYPDAKPLGTKALPWFMKHYAPSDQQKASPYLSILTKDAGSLLKFPQATIITAEIDPLLSEGDAFAAKLEKGGVEVVYKQYSGVTHEFFGMGAVLDQAKAAQQFAAERLKKAFRQM